MTTKKYKQKLFKHNLYSVARIVACASFLVLAIIGVSSLVRAMSLENIVNENGVPASWQAASLGNPDTITVDASYWDQRQDSCDDENRQFEWVMCNYWTAGTVQGVVKDHLGEDGLPIPTYTNSTDAWNANRDVFTANVTGNDPVQPTDNFYRWFHETDKSKRYDRQVTFTRTGKNTYTYGREGVFPLDNVDFSKDDPATKQGHNYHFTSHLGFAMKVAADGKEKFEFSGDDDVWVFLNGKLILDIGGLHEKLNGWFTINPDGTVSTFVQHVNNTAARVSLGKPSSDFNSYVDPLNRLNRETYQDKYETIDVGIQEGDIVNLDFFYAERSTTESNTKITISNMNWPISADSQIAAEIVGKIDETDSHLIQYQTSITNRDPEHPLNLERLAAYIKETSYPTNETTEKIEGYLPLNAKTLHCSKTPDDPNSWEPVEISAPSNDENGFNLATPLTMAPSGTAGDTLYFRYYSETSGYPGTTSSLVSYYTTLDGASGVTYDYDSVKYSGTQLPPVQPDPDPYTLTIRYLYEDGSEAKPTYSGEYYPGDSYSVDTMDDIPGFKPDIYNIRGIVPTNPTHDDLNFVVYYKPEKTTEPIEPVDPIDPVEKTYQVIIHYVYDEDERTAAPDYFSENHRSGESFIVKSPDNVPNHTPNQTEVRVEVIDQDIEVTVRYMKDQEPETPPVEPITPVDPVGPGATDEPVLPEEPDVPTDEPEEPSIPEEPENPEEPIPTPPTIPGSDIIDGDLVYLGPLGEVAFVPNTGIVSSTVAALFEAGFAEIIMSQAFVMVVLFIFASSFCIYFSLRRFSVAPVAKSNQNRYNNAPAAKQNARKTYQSHRSAARKKSPKVASATVRITSSSKKTKK